MFRNKNLRPVVPVLKAVMFGQKGPLKEGEIDRAKDYAGELALELRKE